MAKKQISGKAADIEEGDDVTRIIRSIRKVIQGFSVHSKRQFRRSGLTMPQLMALRAIASADAKEVTAAYVSPRVQLSAATITGVLDRLERAGLITRKRTSSDRRKVCLAVTPKGRKELEKLSVSFQDRFAAKLADIKDADRKAVLKSLETLIGLIEATTQEGSAA